MAVLSVGARYEIRSAEDAAQDMADIARNCLPQRDVVYRVEDTIERKLVDTYTDAGRALAAAQESPEYRVFREFKRD